MVSSSFSPSQTRFLPLFFTAFLLLVQPFSAAEAPESSPSPSPQPPAGNLSPPPNTPSPSPANGHYSPPAPPPEDLSGNSPSPSPYPVADNGGLNRENQMSPDDGSSGGISGGKKAGIAIGVIGAASIAGIGALVYKKRQQNLRRSQYGSAARREFL